MIEHLHDQSPVCLVNLRILMAPERADAVAEAEDDDYFRDAAMAAQGERRLFSGKWMRQAYGPLRKFVFPEGMRRRTNSKLLRRYVACRQTVHIVNFPSLLHRLGLSEVSSKRKKTIFVADPNGPPLAPEAVALIKFVGDVDYFFLDGGQALAN